MYVFIAMYIYWECHGERVAVKRTAFRGLKPFYPESLALNSGYQSWQ